MSLLVVWGAPLRRSPNPSPFPCSRVKRTSVGRQYTPSATVREGFWTWVRFLLLMFLFSVRLWQFLFLGFHFWFFLLFFLWWFRGRMCLQWLQWGWLSLCRWEWVQLWLCNLYFWQLDWIKWFYFNRNYNKELVTPLLSSFALFFFSFLDSTHLSFWSFAPKWVCSLLLHMSTIPLFLVSSLVESMDLPNYLAYRWSSLFFYSWYAFRSLP